VAIPARLSIVTLGARDLDALVAFYEALGWPARRPDDEFARFDTGGATLTLYRRDLLAEDAGVRFADPEHGYAPMNCAINVDAREQVDEAIEMARSSGGHVLSDPVDKDWGGRSAYFADPEGNVWEVAWMPGASFDERGAIIWPGS
jgi:catechol 2,3-dioxygenase-like lactoylglutathione lyase family enzyme